MGVTFKSFLGLVLLVVSTYSQFNSGKIKFKISGRDLKDKDRGIGLGVSDPFIEIFYTERGNSKEQRIGKTSTISNNLNPSWPNIFEFNFDRSKGQTLVLRLYDEDTINRNDKMGVGYVNVAEFVDRGQTITINVDIQGTLTLTLTQAITPNVTPTPFQVVTPTTYRHPVPSGPQYGWITPPSTHNNAVPHHNTQPFVPNYPTLPPSYPHTNNNSLIGGQKLRFKLSAKNLPNKDPFNGKSDPYVEMFFTEGGSTKKKEFGKTKVIEDNGNPVWNEVFEFNYEPAKSQKWVFEVNDKDPTGHDSLLKGEVFLSEYVSRGQVIEVSVPKKEGTLKIEAA